MSGLWERCRRRGLTSANKQNRTSHDALPEALQLLCVSLTTSPVALTPHPDACTLLWAPRGSEFP